MSAPPRVADPPAGGFRHEALLYGGDDAFLDAVVPFVEDGLDRDEPVLVVIDARKVGLLRDALGPRGRGVLFADMAEVGHNPARIIPEWRSFLDEHADDGRRVRGIGEPVWAGRRPAELVECQRHEALLNVAFADSGDWWLLCPYDTLTLEAAVLDEALRTHPVVMDPSGSSDSALWREADVARLHLTDPLPEPTRALGEISFGTDHLGSVRAMVESLAHRFGLSTARTEDFVLATHEMATNSIRHGGGSGLARLWREGRHLVCEVRDEGRLDAPLAGRVAASGDSTGGRGLWLANQLCDLVQIRCTDAASVVRLHIALDDY
jgi:anti-sigma regulatory factor (Ser/Thr protein kinase)